MDVNKISNETQPFTLLESRVIDLKFGQTRLLCHLSYLVPPLCCLNISCSTFLPAVHGCLAQVQVGSKDEVL